MNDRRGGKRYSYCIQALASSLEIPISLKQNKMHHEAPGLLESPYWILWIYVRNRLFSQHTGENAHIRLCCEAGGFILLYRGECWNC